MRKVWLFFFIETIIPIIMGIVVHYVNVYTGAETPSWAEGVIIGACISLLIAITKLCVDLKPFIEGINLANKAVERKIDNLSDQLTNIEKVLVAKYRVEILDVPYFKTLVDSHFKGFIKDNESLIMGYHETHPYNDDTFGVKGLLTTTKSIDAVSSVYNYWERSPFVESYLKAHEQIIKDRKVIVRRIFIASHDELIKLSDMMDRNAKVGVEVYCLESDSEYIKQEWKHEDFLIQDNRLAVILVNMDSHLPSAQGKEIITMMDADVEGKKAIFDGLLKNAYTLKDYKKMNKVS